MDFGMLGNIAWWVQALVWVFVLVCVFLIIIVLLQKGRGGGLSAAFGGAGGQSAFGSKTGDVFTWVTIIVTGIFLLLAIVMTRVYRPENVENQFNSTLTAPAGTTNNAAKPKGLPASSQKASGVKTGTKTSAKADTRGSAAAKKAVSDNVKSTPKADTQTAVPKTAADAVKKVIQPGTKK